MSTRNSPSIPQTSPTAPTIQAYLLDTRKIWNTTSSGKVLQDNARNTIAGTSGEALGFVSREEAANASRFFFHRDAKLSLASSLLKRYFVVSVLNDSAAVPRMPDGRLASRRVPLPATTGGHAEGSPERVGPRWDEVRFGRRGGVQIDGVARGKPCYEPINGDAGDLIDFNTTHQAGLVLLTGLGSPRHHSYSIGVDVTCVYERHARDLQTIEQEGGGVRGFSKFVGMHEDVFSDEDMAAIQANVVDEGAPVESDFYGERPLKQKLRRFYAFWALKEAYVKMEGEALLAEWLRDVEFKNVRVPRPAAGTRQKSGTDGSLSQTTESSVLNQVADLRTEMKNATTSRLSSHDSSTWGETITDIEVYARGRKRKNVQMFLQAFEDDYLVSTAVLRGEGMATIVAPVFQALDATRDISPVARKMARNDGEE